MIKTEKGATKCTGSMPELLADYMSKTRGLFEAFSEKQPEDEAKAQLKEAFDAAFMSNEEMVEHFAKEVLGKMFEAIKGE